MKVDNYFKWNLIYADPDDNKFVDCALNAGAEFIVLFIRIIRGKWKKIMKDYIFEIEMKVRDYECDSQGIVNNANYLHYMENTRHEFLESLGVYFIDLQKQGVEPVVSRIDIKYLASLRSTDIFVSKLKWTREGVKNVFFQEIYRKKDNKLCCKAKVEIAIMENGKLTRGDYFDNLLK